MFQKDDKNRCFYQPIRWIVEAANRLDSCMWTLLNSRCYSQYKKNQSAVKSKPFHSKALILLGILWIFSAAAASEGMSPASGRIIVIDKAKKQLILYRNGRATARSPISFGIDPNSDKYKAFDCATPEGRYVITYKKIESPFHRFLGISYPNRMNAEKALASGIISKAEFERVVENIRKSRWTACDTGLGCDIGIHGGGVFRSMDHSRERDWTEGCIALNNPDIEKLFDSCKPGDPVIIFNSSRNLYGIIRPFTHATELDANGIPVCENGAFTYQTEMATSLGRMVLTLKEGKDYGRSIDVRVYGNGASEQPSLVLVDRNADGYMSSLDSVSGPDDLVKNPEAAYRMIREAVIAALSTGVF
ncbi:L,D-transpeptidase family protein [Desulfatirhabdium butyrativorans]|uniref:L,D-transpeptidase family protein n=1 Tax=Desulfatirhabdium butyrativorans TaxID=340467 RepID=UPI000688BC99|nr:L,D-transpeptidase [Desulfatirhabdium butyrativorans]